MQVRQHQRVAQQQHQLSLSSSPSNRDAQEVKQIGNYILSKTIGRGTFGKVKLGIHTLTQEKYHLITAGWLQIIETNDCLYLVLEYASNGELFDFIVRKRRLNDQETCLVLAQILNALEYLHNLDITHRDLKPENLLFDHNYELKLVDFGLSKMCEDANQQLYTCCGSPCYASPETISSQPYIGRFVDMWSCGIILFAMLCGYLPFDDDNQSALFAKIISCEYYIPNDISQEAQHLIRGLLKKDPKQRLSIAEIKNSAFYINQMQGTRVKPGIRLGLDQIYVDEGIIEQLQIYGVEPSFARQSIISNSHNSTTATYYLLKNRFLRNPLLNKRPTQPQIINCVNKAAINIQKGQVTINLQSQPENHVPQTTIQISQTVHSSPKLQNMNLTYPQNIHFSTQETPSNKHQSSKRESHKIQTVPTESSHKSSKHSFNMNSSKEIQVNEQTSKHTPSKSKTQYFEQRLSSQVSGQNSGTKQHKISPPISGNSGHQNSLGFSQIVQQELNSSSEEYYNGGVQQMRSTYVSALGNYQNQILSTSSTYVPSNLNNINQLISAHSSSPYNASIVILQPHNAHQSNNVYQTNNIPQPTNIPQPNSVHQPNNVLQPNNSLQSNNILNANINSTNLSTQPQQPAPNSMASVQPQLCLSQNENLLTKTNSSNNDQKISLQKSSTSISNIPSHAVKTNIQSKKTSQIDISTQKYIKAEYKKRNLFLNEYSLDNAKCVETSPSPKGVPPLSISQDAFYQKPTSLIQSQEKITSKSPSNFCSSQNGNFKVTPNNVKQKQFLFMQENAKKIEVIKKIIDSVRSTKKNSDNLQQTPRITPFQKTQQNSACVPDLYLKRKSVPLFLSTSKEEQLSPKQININLDLPCQDSISVKQSNSKSNETSSYLHQISYKGQKLNKTQNPSVIWNLNQKQDAQLIKSDRNQIIKKKNSQGNQIPTTQSLLKSHKETLLYYPESLNSSNKKNNKLQIIFNSNNKNNSSLSKEQHSQNNLYLNHSSNHTSQHHQTSTSNLYQNPTQTKKLQLNPSSVKGSKDICQFFSSISKQNQQSRQKNGKFNNVAAAAASNQSHNLASSLTQQLKTTSSQGQDELFFANTNATITSSTFNPKQNGLNNTNSTCADANVSAIILNDYLSDPYRRSDELVQNSSEDDRLQHSLSVHKPLNMQDLAKITQSHAPINRNNTKPSVNQVNHVINNTTNTEVKTSAKGQTVKIDKNYVKQQLGTNQFQIINNLSPNAVNSLLFKKNITVSSTENGSTPQQNPLSTKNATQQAQSPLQNNFFMENSPNAFRQIKPVVIQKQQMNNKINSQKRFLFDQ